MVERSDNKDNFLGKKNKIKARYFSKIKGGFRKHYEIMVDKLANMNKLVDISRLIAFDSFDSANHLETVEGKIDLVSFNTTFINQHLLSKLEKYSTTRSNSILTWIQISAKEEPCILLTIL